MDAISVRILQILHENGQATYRDISEDVERSINAVRDRIIGMEKKGIIRGYQARISPPKQNHALAFLYQEENGPDPDANFWLSPRIVGAYSGAGRYSLVVHLQCGSLPQMAEFLRKGLQTSGFRLGALEQLQPPEVGLAGASNLSDDLPWQGLELSDWKIIAQLRRNARAPIRTMAEALKIPETTVRDRVHKLEARGILRGVHATVQMAALGYPREALVIARVPLEDQVQVVSALGREPTVLNVFASGTRPGQIFIHAVGGPTCRIMDLISDMRHYGKMEIKHFQPIEKIFRHNPTDGWPGRKIEKKGRNDGEETANPALENFVLPT